MIQLPVMGWGSEQPNFYPKLCQYRLCKAKSPYKSDAEKLCDRPFLASPLVQCPPVSLIYPPSLHPAPCWDRKILVPRPVPAIPKIGAPATCQKRRSRG